MKLLKEIIFLIEFETDTKKDRKDLEKLYSEVEDYAEVFDAQGFGTIGTVIYYDYQMDMRKFRTLLLMLYL